MGQEKRQEGSYMWCPLESNTGFYTQCRQLELPSERLTWIHPEVSGLLHVSLLMTEQLSFDSTVQ